MSAGLEFKFTGPGVEPNPLKEQIARMRANRLDQRLACNPAKQALDRLVEVMRHGTGQGYKLRSLLYSLWNGKPAPLIDILNLDWQIRKDVLAVLLAFGYEDADTKFFYDSISFAIRSQGLFSWFIEEAKNTKPLKDFVQSMESMERSHGPS